MRTTIAFPTLLALALFQSGCTTYISIPKVPAVPAHAVPEKGEHTVAVLNATPLTGNTRFVTLSLFWKYDVNLHDVGEAAVSWTQQALTNLNVKVDNRAEKKLWLHIPKAYGKQGMWTLQAHVVLKAKTGSGLEKEYIGQRSYVEDYRAAAAIEKATIECVSQMLKDKDILDYLRQ